eukprot:jgi/Botrbrau1/16351/Bobra.178_1s0004.1
MTMLDHPIYRRSAEFAVDKELISHDSWIQVLAKSYVGGRNAENSFHGHGTVEFSNQNTYCGTIEDNQLHGTGTYKWMDGTLYKGTFAENRASGSGMMQWPRCGKYIGQMEDGVRNGKGRFEPEGTDVDYEGEWVNGKRHGHGRLTYSYEPLCYYEGDSANKSDI